MPVSGKKTDSNEGLSENYFKVLIIITAIAVVPIIILLYMWYEGPSSSTTGLSAILIFGVIALILVLALLALVFRGVGLADKEQTLGLPEGSVRAIIALSLILIFMISSMFIYSQLQNGGTTEYKYTGITQQQLDNISKTGNIVSISRLNETNANNQTLFDATQLVSTVSTEATDIAKQIITTVSTLVVAVAGFYFGSKAVGKDKADGEEKEPVKEVSTPVISSYKLATGFDLLGTAPLSILKVENTLEISDNDNVYTLLINGKNFKSPTVELRPKSGNPIEITNVLSNSTAIKGKITITKDIRSSDVKWALVVKNSDNEEHILEDVITIKK